MCYRGCVFPGAPPHRWRFAKSRERISGGPVRGTITKVRKLGVIVVAVLTMILAGCTSSAVATSTTSTPPTTTAPARMTAQTYSSSYPVAISFSDASHGLMLIQGCRASVCKSWVEVTADGGKHWQLRPAFVAYPVTDYIKVQGVAIENPAPDPNRFGVEAVVLASASDGWAYGPGLFVTHDGGRLFSRVKVSAGVLAVAASSGKVWVLEQRCFIVKTAHASLDACSRSVLLTGPAGGERLSPVAQQPPGFPLPPGYEEGTQFPLGIVHASSSLVVLSGVFGLDVSTNGGRTWRQSRYPCTPPYANADSPGSAAVDPSGSLWLICEGAPGAGFQRKQLWRSFDDGRSWFGPYQLSPVGYADELAAVSSTAAWAYGSRASIFHSTDGGHSWKAMLVGRFNNATGGPRGFSAVGGDDAWIVAPQGESTPFPTELLRTVAAGRTWSLVQLPA